MRTALRRYYEQTHPGSGLDGARPSANAGDNDHGFVGLELPPAPLAALEEPPRTAEGAGAQQVAPLVKYVVDRLALHLRSRWSGTISSRPPSSGSSTRSRSTTSRRGRSSRPTPSGASARHPRRIALARLGLALHPPEGASVEEAARELGRSSPRGDRGRGGRGAEPEPTELSKLLDEVHGTSLLSSPSRSPTTTTRTSSSSRTSSTIRTTRTLWR